MRQHLTPVGALLLIACGACVPAAVPPQLAYTPGPAVRIMDHYYDSGTFQARVPAGWQVVTSAAVQPVSVIFAAPEGDALIMLGESLDSVPDPAGYSGALRQQRQTVTLANGVQVMAALNAPPENWDARLTIFQDVIASLAPAP